MSIRLDSVERAIADIAAGRAVVVVDDADREKHQRHDDDEDRGDDRRLITHG